MEKLNEFLKVYDLKKELRYDRTYGNNKNITFSNDFMSLELYEYKISKNTNQCIINLATYKLQDNKLINALYKCETYFNDYFKKNDTKDGKVFCYICNGKYDMPLQTLTIEAVGTSLCFLLGLFFNVFNEN